MPEYQPLEVDEKRLLAWDKGTGIYVQAMLHGEIRNYDIFELTADSLHRWLRSNGGENPIAERVVAVLLGHDKSIPPWTEKT